MPYIGNQPAEQFTSFATQEFSTSATTSYTLDHAVTNENEIALFINNVRQQPGSGKAYTATGTALTLSAATASTDTMYCVFLGRALQTVNPATNSITAAMVSANAITGAKLNTDVISAQTALGAEPADTDEFLVSDAGVLKRVDYSYIKPSGTQTLISTATASGSSEIDITSGIDSTYKNYLIRITNMHPATDNTDFRCRFFTSAGIRTGTDYQFSFQGRRSNGGDIQGNGNGNTYISLSPQMAGNDAVENSNYEIILSNPSSTTYYKSFRYWNNIFNTESLLVGGVGSGSWNSTTAVTGLRFYMDSGNIDDGRFDLIGLS
jgi:hypothetical protein